MCIALVTQHAMACLALQTSSALPHTPQDFRGGGGYIYKVSQEERTKLRESVPYVKLYRYNPKHLYPKFNGYGDNGKRSLKL